MKTETSTSPEKGQQISDSTEMIAQAHFERYTSQMIDKLITYFGKGNTNELGLRKIYYLLCRAVNDPNYTDFAATLKPTGTNIEKILQVISDQSNGVWQGDILYEQCQRLSDLGPNILATVLANNMKEKTNKYLNEKDLGEYDAKDLFNATMEKLGYLNKEEGKEGDSKESNVIQISRTASAKMTEATQDESCEMEEDEPKSNVVSITSAVNATVAIKLADGKSSDKSERAESSRK